MGGNLDPKLQPGAYASHLELFLLFQEPAEVSEGVSISSDGQVLTKDGAEYRIGDHVYVHPDTFDQLEQAATAEVPDYAAKGRFHKVIFLQTELHFCDQSV